MPDFGTMSAAYSAISSAIGTAKMLNELSKRIDNAELTHAVADLTLSLAEVKGQLAESLQENIDLRRKLDEANEAKSIIPFREWLVCIQDPAPRSPICPQCWADRKIVRMKKYLDNGEIAYWCPEHTLKIWLAHEDRNDLLSKLGDT